MSWYKVSIFFLTWEVGARRVKYGSRISTDLLLPLLGVSPQYISLYIAGFDVTMVVN